MKNLKLVVFTTIISTFALANPIKENFNLSKYINIKKMLFSKETPNTSKKTIKKRITSKKTIKKRHKSSKRLDKKLAVNIKKIKSKDIKIIPKKHIHVTKNSNKIFKTTKLIRDAKKLLGVRYRYGGTNEKRGIDCSSFVQKTFRKNGKNLPRTSRAQASCGRHIAKSKLKQGDLLFFRGEKGKNIGHVGIYIGQGRFIHASSGAKKVTISSLNKSYYKSHYKGARRV